MPKEFAVARLEQSGEFDMDFGQEGKTLTKFNDTDSSPTASNRAVAVDPYTHDVWVVGKTEGNGQDLPKPATARFTADGDLDDRFVSAGMLISSSYEDDSGIVTKLRGTFRDITIDDTRRAVAVGESKNENNRFLIARFNRNGSLDETLGPAGVVVDPIGDYGGANAITLDQTGNIVVAGSSQSDSPNTHMTVVRYNPDGSRDQTFAGNGVVRERFSALEFSVAKGIAIDNHCRIVVSGSSRKDGEDIFAVIRYQPDGTVDETFGNQGLAYTDVPSFDVGDGGTSLALGNDGKIFVGGSVRTRPEGNQRPEERFGIWALKENGKPDYTWTSDALMTDKVGDREDQLLRDIAVDRSGKVLAVGLDDNRSGPGPSPNLLVVRYKKDGSIDESFSGGAVSSPFSSLDVNHVAGESLAIDGHDRVVSAGSASV